VYTDANGTPQRRGRQQFMLDFDEIACQRARRMLAEALEAEAQDYPKLLGASATSMATLWLSATAMQKVERSVCGAGAVEAKAPRSVRP
jgi:hypothetical protein